MVDFVVGLPQAVLAVLFSLNSIFFVGVLVAIVGIVVSNTRERRRGRRLRRYQGEVR
jgi:hypothetical protein